MTDTFEHPITGQTLLAPDTQVVFTNVHALPATVRVAQHDTHVGKVARILADPLPEGIDSRGAPVPPMYGVACSCGLSYLALCEEVTPYPRTPADRFINRLLAKIGRRLP